MACYDGAASTCRGKNFVPFGAGSGINFSQTRASHNKRDGFNRERTTFGDGTISVASYCFQKNSSVNIEQQECCVQYWNFLGFVWPFYTLTGFSRHFMCIIQTWHAIMEWHPTCCGIFCVHFQRRSTRITANKGILKQISATLTSQTFV